MGPVTVPHIREFRLVSLDQVIHHRHGTPVGLLRIYRLLSTQLENVVMLLMLHDHLPEPVLAEVLRDLEKAHRQEEDDCVIAVV